MPRPWELALATRTLYAPSPDATSLADVFPGVPALAWDDRLAADAAGYARQMVHTNQFRHSHGGERDEEIGENLWMGTHRAYGYTAMLWKLADELHKADGPTHMAVILDKSSQTFRNAMYDQYKAHRPPPPEDLVPQFPMIRDATRAFSLPCIEEEGWEADDLIASYARHGGINHLDGKNLPSKTAIAGITVDLLRLLFPGFFEEKPLHSSELKVETATLMDSVQGRLEDEMLKALEYHPRSADKRKDLRPEARRLTLDFLGHLPRIREVLQTDAEAAFNGDPAALSKEEVIVAYPCIEAIAVQRLAHELYKKHVPLIPRIMTEWAHSRTGIDIHPGATIGDHFFIDHGTGVVIGETSEIGDDVLIYQGVTLGALSVGPDVGEARKVKRHPTIEDDVTIYAGASIFGSGWRVLSSR